MINPQSTSQIKQRLAQIDNQIQVLNQEKQQLIQQLGEQTKFIRSQDKSFTINKEFNLSPSQKVNLFLNRFLGRQDVFAYRWQSKQTTKSGYSIACENEWQAPCQKPKIKCSACPNRQFQPLSKQVIYDHLIGNKTVGVYPLLIDPLNHCHFLAIDFDKSDWQQAIKAVSITCQKYGFDHLIERSRSGNGGHIWFFFAQPIQASLARQFGTLLLDKSLNIYPALNFESYDRMFPNQDTIPIGGFGNLIALPLQRQPRNLGNSVFVDENFEPLPDQWFSLQQVQALSHKQLLDFTKTKVDIKPTFHKNLAKDYIPIWKHETADTKKILQSNTHQQTFNQLEPITIIISAQVFIPTKHLTNPIIAKLIQLASYNNPNFYKTQAMRFSTFGIPRRICMAHLEDTWLSLPRGCLQDAIDLFNTHHIQIDIQDKRQVGKPLYKKTNKPPTFKATLTPEQKLAKKAILQQNIGILQAPTAFGKTIVAINTIIARKRNTLVLVHSRALMSQWQDKLNTYLSGVNIGEISNRKNRRTMQIDVATYQSLLNKKDKDNKVKLEALDYGYVIIDECHHVSAPNFSLLLSEIAPKYLLGLTATPERQDGHHPIMLMQIGQIIFKANKQPTSFKKKLLIKILNTDFPEYLLQQEKRPHVSEIFNYLATHDKRNQHILKDMQKVISEGRFPLLLTQRKDHAQALADSLIKAGVKTVLLTGGLGVKQQQTAKHDLIDAKGVIATGKYVGEGFDLPRLDTLFLATPVSWKGLVIQYLGRIHRQHANKSNVQVYDYVDINHPMLKRMHKRRQTAYRKEGYEIR